MPLLTTAQFAARTGVSVMRVRHWLIEGRIRSARFGPAHAIDARELAKVRHRKNGRPRKAAE